MNRIDKATDKQLKQIAGKLPVMYTGDEQYTMRRVKGDQLLANNIKSVGSGATKELVTEDRTYLQKVAEGVKVNHYKRLKTIYQEKSNSGVLSYVTQVMELNGAHSNLLSELQNRHKLLSI